MTEFINDPLFYKCLNGADIDMDDLYTVCDELVEVLYKSKHKYDIENKKTNTFIVVFLQLHGQDKNYITSYI